MNIKKFLIGGATSAIMLGAMITPAFAAGPWYVDPSGNDANTCSAPGASTACLTIQAAINLAESGDTINVAAGTYTEVGQIVINRDLTIIGADKTTTIIKPAQDTGDPSSGNARGWFLTSAGITFNMSGVTLDGVDKNICFGIYDYSLGTIQDINIKNIGCEQYYGRAIYLKNNATIRNVRFENIARIGVFVWQGATAAVIDGNTYVGKGPGDHLDYGIELGNGGVATITNNTISNNTGEAADGSTSAGILATTFFGPGTQATITGNTLTNNTDGIAVGYCIANNNPVGSGCTGPDTSVVVANRNNISGNTTTGVVSTGPTVNATCNWWGAANGPGSVGPGSGDNVSTNVTFTPWLTSTNLDGTCNGPFITTPTITTPGNGATVTTSAFVEVDWSDSTGSNPTFQYQYEAFSDAGYTSSLYDSGMTLSASEIPTPGTPPGDYYLRVRAQDAIGTLSDWSNGSEGPYKITVVADPINPFDVPAQCDQSIAYNLIEGTSTSNVINGTNGPDLILAKGGSDKVDGKGGADCIVGGAGSDKLIGGNGADVILGGDGSDSIEGNNDADKLYGEGAGDSIKGGNGADQLFGGDGSDSLKGEAGTDLLDGGNQIDSANGGGGTDTCTAESENSCEI